MGLYKNDKNTQDVARAESRIQRAESRIRPKNLRAYHCFWSIWYLGECHPKVVFKKGKCLLLNYNCPYLHHVDSWQSVFLEIWKEIIFNLFHFNKHFLMNNYLAKSSEAKILSRVSSGFYDQIILTD